MAERKFDLLVFGASGFTGRQTAAYLRQTAPQARLGLAGRNRAKLMELARSLKLDEKSVLIADSQDQQAVNHMAKQTRVLVNTAGPFALHGEPVIAACVENRVDYVDITGETPFVRQMIERYHDKARQASVRIVPFCGFDSIPSDIGTLWMVETLRAKSEETRLVKSFFRLKGGFNGGTIASALYMAETGSSRQMIDPLLLVPKEQQTAAERQRSREPQKAVFDPDLKIWTAPFFMAPINSAVVRRSRALYRELSTDYGSEFEYHERLCVDSKGRWLPSTMASLASGAFIAASLSSPGRQLIRKLAPAPGEGPSEEAMDHGFMRCRLFARGSKATTIQGEIRAQGDPGNRITVKMLASSARLLIEVPREELPGGPSYGGILTPASAFGMKLKTSLEQQGITFELTT